MKRSCRKVRASLSMLVVAGLIVSAGVTCAFGQNGVVGSSLEAEKRQVFKLMGEHRKSLVNLKAKVSIVTQTEKLGVVPDKQTGSIKYVAAADKTSAITLVDLKKPREIVGISNGEYTIYLRDLKEAFMGSVTNGTANAARAGLFKLFFSTPDEIQKHFRSVYLGKTTINGGMTVHQLILTPLVDGASQSFELSVDMAGMPLQARIYEKNGDSTTLSLSKIGYNKKIDRSKLAVKFKKGTKIIREEPPVPIPVKVKVPEPVVRKEAATPRSRGILSEILARMAEHSRLLTSLRANVTVIQENAQLGGSSDKKVGTLVYLPVRGKTPFVRLDFQKPDETMAFVHRTYLIYRPSLNQALMGRIDGAKTNSVAGGALAFMNMKRAELKANYEVLYLGEATVGQGVRTWHLRMTPRTRTSYQTAEIWVDGNGMPIQAKIIEHNNDATTATLSNLLKNARVGASEFVIKLPPNTRIIKN